MTAALIEHEPWCPAVQLAGLAPVRTEQYVTDRVAENGEKLCTVHCTRCMECGVIHYMDLVER